MEMNGDSKLKNDDERDQETKVLCNRIVKLSEVSRRINKSLDISTVLQEILDSARLLTDALCLPVRRTAKLRRSSLRCRT